MFPYPFPPDSDDWPARPLCPDCRRPVWFYRARETTPAGQSYFRLRLGMVLHIRQCYR